MPTRRAHTRTTRLAAHPLPPANNRLLSSQTFTLIASWRGQLLICTVVLVVGAIYFVIREPVRRWRRRQRERLSRAFTEELLATSTTEAKPQRKETLEDKKDRGGPSVGASAAVTAKEKTSRERCRERRKERKAARSTLLRVCSATTADTSLSSITSSPTLAAANPSERVPAVPPLPATEAGPSQPAGHVDLPSTVSLESSSLSETDSPPSMTPDNAPTPPSPGRSAGKAPEHDMHERWESSSSSPLRPTPPALEIELSTDGDESTPDRTNPPVHKHVTNSYSIIPEESYLPLSQSLGRKKKRKSKARGGSESIRASSDPVVPSSKLALQGVSLSSDDLASSNNSSNIVGGLPTAPSSPQSARRSLKSKLVGLQMSPALELMISNHERTIDSLRAEIGHAKAEESKAREDEVRAREELRRSRATEDRMRADYERARKTRDRAESESRRFEAELMVLRNRFDTLTHMYQAVCGRLREVEMGSSDGGAAHPSSPMALSPHLSTHVMAFSTGVPGTPVGLMPYSPGPGGPYSPVSPMGGIAPHAFPFHTSGASPSPLRRAESSSGAPDPLAGPLTPGASATPSLSVSSSPYPSHLSLKPLSTSTSASTNSNTSESARLSAAELRRINIASSVLKKKKKPEESESGDSNPKSSSETVDLSMSKSSPSVDPLDGLGISQMAVLPSAFPSANGTRNKGIPKPTKQRSTSSMSSDSSAPPGRSIIITPSSTDVFRSGQNSPESLTTPGLNGCDAPSVYVREPEEVDLTDDTPTIPLDKHRQHMNALNNHLPHGDDDDDNVDRADDAEIAPMFASLAHTPEQLAEFARIRQEALRDRQRRASQRQRSASANDL